MRLRLQHGEVTVTLLNLNDIRRTQACSGGKELLGQVVLLPRLTDGRSKEREQQSWIAW